MGWEEDERGEGARLSEHYDFRGTEIHKGRMGREMETERERETEREKREVSLLSGRNFLSPYTFFLQINYFLIIR